MTVEELRNILKDVDGSLTVVIYDEYRFVDDITDVRVRDDLFKANGRNGIYNEFKDTDEDKLVTVFAIF